MPGTATKTPTTDDFEKLHQRYQATIDQITYDIYGEPPTRPKGGTYDERHNWDKEHGAAYAHMPLEQVIADLPIGSVLSESEGYFYDQGAVNHRRDTLNPWTYNQGRLAVLVAKSAKTVKVVHLTGITYAENSTREPGDLGWDGTYEADKDYAERWGASGNRRIIPMGYTYDELTKRIRNSEHYRTLLELRAKRAAWQEIANAEEDRVQAELDKKMAPFKDAAEAINKAVGFRFVRATAWAREPRLEIDTYSRGKGLIGTETLGEIIAGRVALEKITEAEANLGRRLLLGFKVPSGWNDNTTRITA